jgi:hypothetical protein
LPRQALFSLLTLGLWPMGQGPMAAIRFAPLAVFVAVFVPAHRAGRDEVRAVVHALVAALVQAVAVYALTWVAWAAFAAGPGDLFEDVQDTFRILVSSNVDGYWTNGQAQRFLIGLGAQAETALLAVQGAVIAALAILVLASTASWSALLASWKARVGLSSYRRIALVAGGLLISRSVVPSASSATDPLAWALFIISLAGWTFVREAEDDDRTFLCTVVAVVATAFLGWPVAIGWAIVEVLRRQVGAWGGLWGQTAVEATSNVALAWVGLAFGLRGAAVGSWVLPLLAALAFAATGAWVGSKLLRSALAPSWQVGYLIGVSAISSLISGQFWSIIPFIACAVAALALWGRETAWEAGKTWVLDGYMAIFLVLLAVAPRLLAR